jgi:mannose-6-phosphate isomerase-like protein (cupin superfamily)
VLYTSDTVKVKELYIEPNHAISLQRHSYRSEYWHVVKGMAQVLVDGQEYILGGNAKVEIPVGSWHKLSNPAAEVLKVIELQYGQRCVEEDIERNEKVETWIQ